MQATQQKEALRVGYPPLLEKKPSFNKLEKIPFEIYERGSIITGTVTPIGEPLFDGTPSAFHVRMPGKRMLTISNKNGVWNMPADENLVLELGVWIELHYQSER
jgi:hypothetical protein